MNKRDTPKGVLHPRRHVRHVELTLHQPSAEAAPFVEHYWCVRWELSQPYESQVLSHPHVHLVFEQESPLVYGVVDGLFTRRLTGADQALGIKFRPGAFRTFSGVPVSELTNRRTPAADFFGVEESMRAHREIRAATAPEHMAAAAEVFLLPRLPARPDPNALVVATAVDTITADPSLLRVETVAETMDLSVRTLQRLFAEYVGVGPKWVLRRARLHEAAAAADAGTAVNWANLAADLGYADQAHLTRDFTATIGVAPAAYQRAGNPDSQ